MKVCMFAVAGLSLLMPVQSVNAQRVGTAKFIEPFSDEAGDTVNAYAKYMSISKDEAFRRLALMTKAGSLAKKLQEKYPDSFAGLSVKHSPNLTFDLRFKGEAGTSILNKVRLLTSDTELLKMLGASPAPRSAKETSALARTLYQEMKLAGVAGEVATNYQTGEIKALVRDPSAFSSAMSRGRFSTSIASAGIKVERFSGIQLTTDLVGAYYTWDTSDDGSCTTGFNVLQTATGVHGVTTAGHCTNSPARLGFSSYHVGNPVITYVGEWVTNGIDLQWGYVVYGSGNVNFTIVPKFTNRQVNITVTGGAWEYPGMYLCKYGSTTNITCGEVDPYAYTDSYGEFSRVNKNGIYPIVNNFGDSGGPVYQGSLAVGTVHGKDASGNMYFTPIRKWGPAGVNIGVLCSC